jgi:hypothetical protein
MPKRLHPARFVVLRRSNRWKKGTWDDEPSAGLEIVASALSTVHGSSTFAVVTMEGSAP